MNQVAAAVTAGVFLLMMSVPWSFSFGIPLMAFNQ